MMYWYWLRNSNNALLSGLHDNIEGEIFDACCLLLDRLALRTKSCDSNVERAYVAIRRNRRGSACLAALAG
jgi:hypothetical protein